MKRSSAIAAAFVCIVGASVLSAQAYAQGTDLAVGVGIAGMDAKHSLLNGTMVGFDVLGKLLRRGSPFHIRFGVSRLTGTTQRTGVACTGLVNPTACPSESVEDKQQFATAFIGGGARVLTKHSFAIELTGDLHAGKVQVDSRGQTTKKEISANRTLWGGMFGAEVAWLPLAKWPLAVELGGGGGGMMPLNRRQVLADGYVPFETGFNTPRVRLGLSWRVDLR